MRCGACAAAKLSMTDSDRLWQAAPPEKRREVERRGIERRTSGIYDLIDAIGLLGARALLSHPSRLICSPTMYVTGRCCDTTLLVLDIFIHRDLQGIVMSDWWLACTLLRHRHVLDRHPPGIEEAVCIPASAGTEQRLAVWTCRCAEHATISAAGRGWGGERCIRQQVRGVRQGQQREPPAGLRDAHAQHRWACPGASCQRSCWCPPSTSGAISC